MKPILAALTLLLLAGCATQRTNWEGRVGIYTFDQAVTEMGPPDKQAKLQDGTVVAEWLTHRGYAYSSPAYYPWGYPYYGPAPLYSGYVDSAPDYYLRLMFAPDGKLRQWKKFSK